ncbi:MAG TPA: STAS domain-containing protein, partial [Candidatus Baltobacteraceae bacterium]|nr:STAS domain-containing protein [Candidatus Baltobacteraceae bacterium]
RSIVLRNRLRTGIRHPLSAELRSPPNHQRRVHVRVAGKATPNARKAPGGRLRFFRDAPLEQGIGYRNVTIDLAHTTFIDASIIGVFVRLANRCRKNNAAQVHIVNASTHVRRLFSICKLEGFFGTAAR